MSVIGEMKDEEIWDLKVAHKKEIAALRAAHRTTLRALRKEFVTEVTKSLDAVKARTPADPEHRVGGQRHPTITKEFVADELVGLIDKFEFKPFRAVFGKKGNFISWSTIDGKVALKAAGVEFNVYKMSVREANMQGLTLPGEKDQ